MKKRFLIELVLFATYALFAMSWKAGDMLVASQGLSGSQVAVMTNAITIAKIIGSIISAGIIAKLGNRKMFIFSCILIIAGTLLPFVKDFPLIFLIRFILGLGGAFVLVTINPIAASTFEGEELAVVNGLNSVAFNVGLAVVLTFAGTIAANPGNTIIILGALIAVMLVLWILLSGYLKEKKTEGSATEKKTSSYTLMDGLKERFNLVFAISYSGLLAFYLVAFTFMKAENVKYVIYAGVVGALVGTFTTKGYKDKLKIVRISALLQLISAIAFILLYNHEAVKIVGLVLGFFIFFPMPAYVNLAFMRKGATPEKISVTFSIFWALSYLVSSIIIQIFGFLTDKTGGTLAPFIFIVCMESMFFIGSQFFIKKEEVGLE